MSRWKGKGRAFEPRAVEGDGQAGGIVLPLDMVGSGVFDVAYTLPVKFGQKGQQFSLQVDTGSSDLWVASTSCSTSSCKATSGYLYDPSGSRPTNQDFTIPYLSGSAAGPIVWDRVEIGGYSIDNQALAAATDVENEPLGPKFSGILGLALPLNSIIATDIPPVTNNDPDGAAWASNLFSITPSSLAPVSRFLSLSLSRPGSDRIPAQLGIGRHPSALVPDPSKVLYSTLVSERSGTLFWKASVRAITVYVDGVAKQIQVGRSNTGAVFPSAVFDSGVPYIFTTTTIANAIYGAINISPGKDGMYYVPCSTPLNLTFTIDNRPEIPIHPLDLTAEPADDNKAQFCVGLIQTADAQLAVHDSTIGDMILGVPFMRNVYTVMAYATPSPDGSFAILNSSTDGGLSQTIRPRLGLMALTDPTTALKEFTTVRVLNQPISSSASTPPSNTGSDSNTKTVNIDGKKLSVGIIVLIAVLGFFAVCGGLFLVRWALLRRKFKQGRKRDALEFEGMSLDQKAAFTLVRGGMPGSFARRGDETLTEDELRDIRYQTFLRKEKKGLSAASETTMDSERTMGGGYVGRGDEFGVLHGRQDPAWGAEDAVVAAGAPGLGPDDTLVGAGDPSMRTERGPRYGEDTRHMQMNAGTPLVGNEDRSPSPPSSPELPRFDRPVHQPYTDADSPPALGPHKPMLSVDQPLLLSDPHHQYNGSGEYAPHGTPRHYTLDDDVYDPEVGHQQETDDLGELGFANGVSMAGIGSASRTSKLSTASSYSYMSGSGIGDGDVHALRESAVLNSPTRVTNASPIATAFNNGNGAALPPINFSMPIRTVHSPGSPL